MVKICPYVYPKSNEEAYKLYYDTFQYELHDFQKWCVEGIVTGNHVLISAPTGTGKTFGGEFAINYFHSKGKKVIYTTPIKALSNEKFYCFSHKYPHISIGLITGDISCNPNADVLIMTTEILLNKLYQIKSSAINSMSFEMDIYNELGAVVFDEIHFINNEERGHVWEQCIMLLPPTIQMVGLSATLDDPVKFANWLEAKGDANKEVYLTRKNIRTVPLIHYSFITCPTLINKCIKDKAIQEEIKRISNKPLVIQNEKNTFNDVTYHTVKKTLALFEKNNVRVKRPFVLNKVLEYLYQNEMLPALCYVFSRKQLEVCAKEITTNLLEFDSKIPYTVDRECETIIRKLSNFEEYLHLPEYINMVALLRRGIGIHHAGLMPILREMTEILFSKGFVKVLFCTETMSVGINLPVKTTIFTDINKFSGETVRILHSHEYTQSSGRAGRLGLDKVGHVIHLNNLFRNIEDISYKNMMNGKPQILTSKFKISYNLLLNLLDIGDNDLLQFANKSMISGDLNASMTEIHNNIATLMCSTILQMTTPIDAMISFVELTKNVQLMSHKKRKDTEKSIQKIKDEYKGIEEELPFYLQTLENKKKIDVLQNEYNYLQAKLQTGVINVLEVLKEDGFIEGDCADNTTLQLTFLGKIASHIREFHCLVFSKLYNDKKLDTLNPVQLVLLFSCFTSIRVADDYRDIVPQSTDTIVNNLLIEINGMYDNYYNKEVKRNINTGVDYYIHYDLLNYVDKWCKCENINECKLVIQELCEQKGIFLGEFVKALLKINNIVCEFTKIAEITSNIEFLSKMNSISNMTMKYVVTNQSLYV